MTAFNTQNLTQVIHAGDKKLVERFMQHQDQWLDFLGNPADVNTIYEKSLKWTIRNKPEMFDTIFSYCPDGVDLRDAVYAACEINRPEMLGKLVPFAVERPDYPKTPNEWDGAHGRAWSTAWAQAMDAAAVRGHLDCMKILLDAGLGFSGREKELGQKILDLGPDTALALFAAHVDIEPFRAGLLRHCMSNLGRSKKVTDTVVGLLYDHHSAKEIHAQLIKEGLIEFFDHIPDDAPLIKRWKAECQREALNAEVANIGASVMGPRKL